MGSLFAKNERNFKRSKSPNKRHHAPSRRPPLPPPGGHVSRPTEEPDYQHNSHNEKYIKHMVEAFQTVIVNYVNVMELVPYLPNIDGIDTYRNMKSSREAMQLLIKRLHRSTDVGGWPAFVNALNSAGYQYISQLLTGKTEEDHTEQIHILNLFLPRLVEDMYVKEFVDKLYARHVISVADKDEIEAEFERRGPYNASLLLLSRIPRKLTEWYTVFTDVLSECGMTDIAIWFKQHSKDFKKTNVRTQQRCSEHFYDDLRNNDHYANDKSDDETDPKAINVENGEQKGDETDPKDIHVENGEQMGAYQLYNVHSETEVEPTEEDIAIKHLYREIDEIENKTKKQEKIRELKQLRHEKLEKCRKVESENLKLTISRKTMTDHVTQTTTGEEIAQRKSMLESMQKEADDKKNLLRLELKKQVLVKEIEMIEEDIRTVEVVDTRIPASSNPVTVDINMARQYAHNEDYQACNLRQFSQNAVDRYQYVNKNDLTMFASKESGIDSIYG